MNWYLAALRQYATFSGRANRREYWIFSLVNFVISLLLLGIDSAIGTFDAEVGSGVLQGIFGLAVLLPSIAVTVRRLHDSDKSAWWLLIIFIPVIGAIVLFVFMLLPGTNGANRFGHVVNEPPQAGVTSGPA